MKELLAQVVKIQQKQQQYQLLELQKQQQNLIEIIWKKTKNSPSSFTYNSDDGITFSAYFRRYEQRKMQVRSRVRKLHLQRNQKQVLQNKQS